MNRDQLLLALKEPPRPWEDATRIRIEARAELRVALARARLSGDGEPLWDQKEMRYWQTVFPKMARWLPDFEQAVLVEDFNRELERMRRLHLVGVPNR